MRSSAAIALRAIDCTRASQGYRVSQAVFLKTHCRQLACERSRNAGLCIVQRSSSRCSNRAGRVTCLVRGVRIHRKLDRRCRCQPPPASSTRARGHRGLFPRVGDVRLTTMNHVFRPAAIGFARAAGSPAALGTNTSNASRLRSDASTTETVARLPRRSMPSATHPHRSMPNDRTLVDPTSAVLDKASRTARPARSSRTGGMSYRARPLSLGADALPGADRAPHRD